MARLRPRHHPRHWLARPTYFAILAILAAILFPTLRDGAHAYRSARLPAPTSATVVRQRHPQGCGAALLATILARHGRPVSEAQLLAEEPPSENGISLAAFRELAQAHGLTGRWRKARRGILPDAEFVAHLWRPAGHFVLVEAQAGDYLHVLDPAGGAAVWHRDTFNARWSRRYLRLKADA